MQIKLSPSILNADFGRLAEQVREAEAAGEIVPEPQDDALATYAPKIQREDARLDWALPAVELERRVRAYRGWPDAFTTWQGKGLKVLAAHVAEAETQPLTPTLSHGERGQER